MTDGQADAREGLFRQEGVVNDTNGVPGTEWAANNSEKYDTPPQALQPTPVKILMKTR